jgi:hypothetical protein
MDSDRTVRRPAPEVRDQEKADKPKKVPFKLDIIKVEPDAVHLNMKTY